MLLLPACLFASRVFAGVVSYEADSFPEEVGWQRDQRVFPADRWIENGWLVQRAELVDRPPPYLDEDEDDIYRRSISEFAGTEAFFLEWRMETDGPREGFPNVSPAAIVAGGRAGISYHFTIAEDQVRLIRDSLLPLVFVDIAPGIPHTYRLELYGTQSYRWLIDGQVVDLGIPEGPYPTGDSEIVFGARAPGETITARWDYIRYGTIPEPATGALLLFGYMLLLRHRRR